MPKHQSITNKSIKSDELTSLKARIAELESTNAMLKQKIKQPKPKRSFLRGLAVTLLVTIGVVSLMLANIAGWAKYTIIDTDGFVSATQPIIEQPAVQTALQNDISDALFENIDLEASAKQSLPQDIAFLAGPLASQVESFAYNKIGEIIRSEQVNEIWTKTLTSLHPQIIAFIQNPNNDGTINVNEIYDYVSVQLSDSPISFLLNKNLPDKVGNITVTNVEGIDEARRALDLIEKLPVVLLMVSLISIIGAVALCRNKRSTLLTILSITTVLLLTTLSLIALAKVYLQDQVASEYSDAAGEIYTVVTNPLVDRTEGYVALFITFILIALFTATSGIIFKVKNFINKHTHKFINKYVPSFNYPDWLDHITANQTVIAWTLFGVLYAIFGVRIPPDASQVVSGFITAIVITLIYLIVSQVLLAAKQKH